MSSIFSQISLALNNLPDIPSLVLLKLWPTVAPICLFIITASRISVMIVVLDYKAQSRRPVIENPCQQFFFALSIGSALCICSCKNSRESIISHMTFSNCLQGDSKWPLCICKCSWGVSIHYFLCEDLDARNIYLIQKYPMQCNYLSLINVRDTFYRNDNNPHTSIWGLYLVTGLWFRRQSPLITPQTKYNHIDGVI